MPLIPIPPAPPAIIEYMQPNCPHVKDLAVTVDALQKLGIVVTERNVNSPAILAEAKALGVPGTPTVIIGQQIYAGDAAVTVLTSLLSGLQK